MIIAEQKPISEILASLAPYNHIVIAGCGTCVTVCMAGGEKETLDLAGVIQLARQQQNHPAKLRLTTPVRQCDREFLDQWEKELAGADCILSLACGAGVQFLTEKFPKTVVIPGVNTKFIGAHRGLGYWTEMCQGCGNCVLDKTGGICPVARCAKSHFNGPCGGSATGKCEIDGHLDCAWQLIYERMKSLNQLDKLLELNEIRDWSTSRDGGPRTVKRTDVIL